MNWTRASLVCLLVCFWGVQSSIVDTQELLRLIRSKRMIQVPEPGNANAYFDEILNNTRQLIVDRNYDPLDIGQVDICSDCVLEGLTTIKRTGDTTLSQEGDDVVISVNVGFDHLRGTCNCMKKILFIRIRGRIRANLRDMALRMTLRTATNTRFRPVLEDFAVTNNGDLDLAWDGKGFIGLISETIFSLVKGKITKHAQKALPGLVRKAIQDNLDKVAMLTDP